MTATTTTTTTTTDDVTTLIHAVDDLETARTAALRVTERSARLLADGLHALRNGSPEVAEEFMERAAATLTRSALDLRAAAYRAA